MTGTNPNYYARESIGELEIKCLNGHSVADEARKRRRVSAGKGVSAECCQWTGKCEDRKSYELVCEFKIVFCELDGCDHECMRKNMGRHLFDGGISTSCELDEAINGKEDELQTD